MGPLQVHRAVHDQPVRVALRDTGMYQHQPPSRSVSLFRLKNRLKSSDFDQEKQQQQPQGMLVFLCIPVAPGRSRVIWAFPQSVSAWPDKFIPRWLHHMVSNTVLDSDLYLLHIEVTHFFRSNCLDYMPICDMFSLDLTN